MKKLGSILVALLVLGVFPPARAFAQPQGEDPASWRDYYSGEMERITEDANNAFAVLRQSSLRFCSREDREQFERRIASVRFLADVLTRHYQDEKKAVMDEAAYYGTSASLAPGEPDPGTDSFWRDSEAQQRTMNDAVNRLFAAFQRTTVRNCNPLPRRNRTVLQNRASSQWPSAPESNPLQDLTRPAVVERELPAIPVFCSAAERLDFYRGTFKPLYEDVYTSQSQALEYLYQVLDRIQNLVQRRGALIAGKRPGEFNPNELAELEREIEVLHREDDYWDPIAQAAKTRFDAFDALGSRILSAPISDCTQARTNGQQLIGGGAGTAGGSANDGRDDGPPPNGQLPNTGAASRAPVIDPTKIDPRRTEPQNGESEEPRGEGTPRSLIIPDGPRYTPPLRPR